MDDNKIANVFTKVPRCVSKFVRDDEKDIFLSIAEHPTLGVTDVTFAVISSPGQRDHVLAQFHAKAFRKTVSKLKDEFNRDELRRILTYCYCSVEIRPCDSCGSISEKGCECELPMKRKIYGVIYPFNSTSEAQNVGVHKGDFRGVAEHRYLPSTAIHARSWNPQIRKVMTKVDALAREYRVSRFP